MRRQTISPATAATMTQTSEYTISVSWNPNHYWMSLNREDAARREFASCLSHADGHQVDLLEDGQVIASACGLRS